MSDSSIRTKPSIEEPSNIISLSSTFSNWLTGTSTFLIVPKISVNCNLKYLTFSSSANLRMSSLVKVRFGILKSSKFYLINRDKSPRFIGKVSPIGFCVASTIIFFLISCSSVVKCSCES